MFLIINTGKIIKYITSIEPTPFTENGVGFINTHAGIIVPSASHSVISTDLPLPIGEVPEKYCFDNGFVLNPEYANPNRSIEELQTENIALRTQVEEHELSQAETELDIDARLISLELGLV